MFSFSVTIDEPVRKCHTKISSHYPFKASIIIQGVSEDYLTPTDQKYFQMILANYHAKPR
jgi:hypothetical protein